MKCDFNCDLGEGEPFARTRALMRWISSANVACGAHAGNLHSMRMCVRLAKQFRVRLGAHPGTTDPRNRGRQAATITPDELELLLLQQVGALEKVAGDAKVKLHHIKLHGALYHASEADERLARRYVRTVRRRWPWVKIYAMAGGVVAKMARRAGAECREEAFLDRAYQDDGSLVPREIRGALLASVQGVTERLLEIAGHGRISSITGRKVTVRAQTLCLHADTPNAVMMARAIRRLLVR